MTVQGGNFGEQADDGAKQPPHNPETRPHGQDFVPPAYAGQTPAQPQPSPPHNPPGEPGPPWSPPTPGYPPPSGYGPPGYPDASAYGRPSYPPPPQYGPASPSGYGHQPQSGYGPPPGYGGPPGYPAPYDPYSAYQDPARQTNGLAIGSLVTSIAGIPLAFFCGIGLLASIVGIVLGAVALNQIKQTHQEGRGLAIAGIAVGAAALVLTLIVIMIAGIAQFGQHP
jgi:uncharacterized protein DUF4190